MKLYELSEMYRELMSAIEDGAIPEDAIEDTLSGLEGSIAQKAESIACIIKELKADTAAIKEEAAKITERAKAKTRQAERLTNYLLSQMKAIGMKKFETPRAKLTVKSNPPSVVFEDEPAFISWAIEKNHDEYLIYDDPRPDKKFILSCLRDGDKLEGVSSESKERLEIK